MARRCTEGPGLIFHYDTGDHIYLPVGFKGLVFLFFYKLCLGNLTSLKGYDMEGGKPRDRVDRSCCSYQLEGI